jgi:hypothetical protein
MATDTTESSAFEASLVIVWILVMVLVVATCTGANLPLFSSWIFGGMVVLQYFYIYQAARKELRTAHSL